MPNDHSLPPEPLLLTEASVQEIQLELIRRHQYNAFDGRKIVRSLRQHRSLWEAVLMDRPGILSRDGTSNSGLIKLRDLSSNYWNVDYLFILTQTLQQAQEIARIAEQEEWLADEISIWEDEKKRSYALGTSDPGYIVSLWWD
jgi:hypothetical protein